MPNLSVVLKQEIARIARKERKGEMQQLKKTVAQYRSQIAELKRRLQTLEQQMRREGRGRSATTTPAEDDDAPQLRFSSKGFAAQRKRLGLSAASVAKILGVSALSVYKWESGKTRPRARQLEAIAGLRKMGKREAEARLDASSPDPRKAGRKKAA